MTLDSALHWKFAERLRLEHAPCFVAAMNKGRVCGPCGAVITPDDCLLRDVSRESASPESAHSDFYRLWLGPLRRVEKRVAVLATVWSNVYFHWMLDVLPRVELLNRAGLLKSIDAFVVSQNALPFQRQSLLKLGLNSDRLIVADRQRCFHLEAAELIVPSLPSALDNPMGWACEFIQKQFKPRGTSAEAGRRRLYVTRAAAKGRRILNEAGVLEKLLPAGFECVNLESLTLAEQAELFASAGCVVAPHGAGLTNILFCDPGTVVVDIFAPTYVNPCYWVIANELNLTYCYLLGEGPQPPPGVDPDKKVDDIRVHVPSLMKLLRLNGVNC